MPSKTIAFFVLLEYKIQSTYIICFNGQTGTDGDSSKIDGFGCHDFENEIYLWRSS